MGDPGNFRSAVSGFNKADVLAYINSMSERMSAEEKTFKRKYAELAESRDRLAQKLQLIESLKDNPEGKYLEAQKQIEALKSTVAQKEREISELKNALSSGRGRQGGGGSDGAIDVQQSQSAVDGLKTAIAQRDMQIANLTRALNESRSAAQGSADPQSASPDLSHMHAQLSKAKAILQEMQNRLAQKDAEIAKLNSALDQRNKDGEPSSVPAQPDPNMQAQLMKAKIIIQEMQSRLTQKDSEIKDLNTSLAESKKEAEDAAPAQSAQPDANVQEVLIQAKKIIDKLKARISEDEQTIARLNAELEQGSNSGQTAAVDYAPQMAQAQGIIEELKNRLSSNEAELNQMRNQFELASRELESARAQAFASQGTQDKLNSNEAELNQARNQLELAGRELEVLRSQAAALQETQNQLAANEQELSQARSQLELAGRELEVLSSQTAALQEAQNRLTANQLELEQTRGQLEFAQREREVFNAKTVELQEAQNALAARDAEMNQIRSQLEFAGRELEALNARAAELQEARNRLAANELELNHTKSQLELAGRELQVLGAQAAELQQAQSRLTANELEMKQARSQLEFAGREIEVLNAKAAELQESKNKLLEAQVAINNMQLSLKDNDKEINNLKLLLASKEEQERELRQKAVQLNEDQKKISKKMAYDSLRIELGSVFVEAQSAASSIMDKARAEAERISSQSKKSVLDLLRDLSLVQSEMSNIKKTLKTSASVVSADLERAGGKLETMQKDLLAQTKVEQTSPRSDLMEKEMQTSQRLKGILDDYQTKGSAALPVKPQTPVVGSVTSPPVVPRPQFQFQSQTPSVQPQPQFQPVSQQPRSPQPKTPGSFSEYFNRVEQEIDNSALPSMGNQFRPEPKPEVNPEVPKIVGGFNINPKIFVSPKKPSNPYDHK